MNGRKLTIDELILTDTYWYEKSIIELHNHVSIYISENQLSHKDLSVKSKCPLMKINDFMRGDKPVDLESFIKISIAIEKIPIVNFTDKQSFITKFNEAKK